MFARRFDEWRDVIRDPPPPGPQERQLRNRLHWQVRGYWPSSVVEERLRLRSARSARR